MRILVTGGTGVIGAWVIPKLLEKGTVPVVLDIRDDFSLMPELAGKVELIQADVTDSAAVAAAVKQADVECIVHLAAFIDPDMATLPYQSFRINTLGTVNILEAARLAKVRRVVAASSRAVYGGLAKRPGDAGYRPIGETEIKNPISAYDVTKHASELMGKLYRDVHGIEYAALRFAGIYGPGKQARHGKMSLRSRLVEEPFAGRSISIQQGGDQVDDMIYVADVAEGVVLAALAPKLNHEAYNIASGVGRTLRDFATAVRAALPEAEISVGPGENPMELAVNYAAIFDISRARGELGFAPKFDLVAGVQDYVDRIRAMNWNKP
jgi:UDP-glucose 4-epimerase